MAVLRSFEALAKYTGESDPVDAIHLDFSENLGKYFASSH